MGRITPPFNGPYATVGATTRQTFAGPVSFSGPDPWFDVVATGNPTTDTANFAAALVAAGNGKKIRLNGAVFAINAGGVYTGNELTIEGAGSQWGTRIDYTGTGPLIQVGTDDAQPADANSYNGPVGWNIRNLTFNAIGTTPLANGQGSYRPNAVAIKDYRGGDWHLDNVRFAGFDQPFWGIQSDLDSWNNVTFVGNHKGPYIGPRSDQLRCSNAVYFIYNDQALELDSCWGASFFGTVFCDNGATKTLSVTTTNGSAVVTGNFAASDDIANISGTSIPLGTKILSVVPGVSATMSVAATASASVTATVNINPIRIHSAYARTASAVYFDGCWFEHLIGQNNVEAFVEIGVGDANQATDLILRNTTVLTNGSGGPVHMKYLVKTGNVTNVAIEGVHGPYALNLDSLVTCVGAVAPQVFLRLTRGQAFQTGYAAPVVASGAATPSVMRQDWGGGQHGFADGTSGRASIQMVPSGTFPVVQFVKPDGTVFWKITTSTNDAGQLWFDAPQTTSRWHLRDSASNDIITTTGDRKIGFFGTTPVAKQATPATLADVIALLQAYGLSA